MDTPVQNLTARQEKLSKALKAADLDGIALNPSQSLTYLTGLHFHLSERPVVGFFTAGGPPTLILPELEAAKLQGLPYELQYFTDPEDLSQWSAAFEKGAAAAGLSGGQVGVEDGADGG